MPGNSQRRGATRTGASKKGPTVGSGGQRRKGLEGRGPTPKAIDRTKHQTHKSAAKRDAEAGSSTAGSAGASTGGALTGGARTGGARTGGARTGGARTGGARTGGARTGDARTGDARTGDARTGDARTGGARTGGARTGGARTGDARTGGARGTAGRGAASRGGSRTGGAGAPRRTKGSSEIVAGRNSVVEALRAEVPVTTMYVAGRIDSDGRVREALKIATSRRIPILETPRGELDRLTDGAVHQGLALQVPPYAYAHPGDLVNPQMPGVPLVVALDGITDPRNLGAIIRSVAAFGGHGVVVPERRSVGMTASAWKTSAGAAARIPVAQCSNLTRTLADFRTAGFFVLGLDLAGDVELPGLPLANEPVVIVVGSEGKGLSRLVRETCDQIVSIPMSSAVESLNAGIATAVTLYEIARQRATG